jgi:hypothetical protein
MSAFRLFPKALRFFDQALVEWNVMQDSASRHGAAPFFNGTVR